MMNFSLLALLAAVLLTSHVDALQSNDIILRMMVSVRRDQQGPLKHMRNAIRHRRPLQTCWHWGKRLRTVYMWRPGLP